MKKSINDDGIVVNPAWAMQIATTYENRLRAQGLSVERAHRLYESYYQALRQGLSPDEAETMLKKDAVRELHASRLDEVEKEFRGKFHYLPKEKVDDAFKPARAYLEAHPSVTFSTVINPLKKSLWSERRAEVSPMAAALKKAGLVS